MTRKTNAANLDQVYMTARQVRELFHVCQKTVCRWREAGKIHGVKVGREYRYPLSEITALMDDAAAAELAATMRTQSEEQ